MPRRLQRLLHALQYAGFLLVELLVRSLSARAAAGLASVGGSAWYLVDRRRRLRATENLRIAFGATLPPGERARLARGAFTSLLRVALEVLQQPRLLKCARDLDRRVWLHGDWRELHALSRPGGTGGVLVTGHVGNWELGARILRLYDVPTRAVMRPIDNPLLDAHAVRARGGADSVIRKRGAVRDVLGTVRQGGWVALLADQNAGRGGVFVPFFGLRASTHPLPAVVALRLRLPLFAAACLRRPGVPFGFDIHVRRIDLGPPEDDVTDERVDAAMARVTAVLEGWVRAAPDQYNWVHRRWKSRPPDEAPSALWPAYAVPYGAPGWAGSGGFRRRMAR